MLRTTVLALAAVIGASAPAVAAPPPPDRKSPDPKSLIVSDTELSKARELVRQLGSEEFLEREDAEHTLSAMGRLARAALYEGAHNDPDPEIRARCRGLLPRAIAIEMQARLDTFLADTEGRFEHELPGWTRLRAMVCGEWTAFGWTFAARPLAEKAARELFVEFLKAPGGRPLLNAISNGEHNLGAIVAAMKYDLYYAKYPRNGGTRRNPSQMEVAVVMFADSLTSASGNPRNTLFTNVLTTSGITQAAQGADDKSAALRAVLGAWIETRTDPYEMYAAMNLATTAKSDAAAQRLAIKLLSAPGAPGAYRGQAMMTLARLKSTDQLPALEKLVGDDTVVTTLATNVDGALVRHTITVGDMALAAAVTVTGQNVADYHIQDRYKGTSSASTSYTRYHIPEEKRKEAATKYGWWRLKQGLKGAK